jgi:uncharacterized protein YqjF (DUF2071 family)
MPWPFLTARWTNVCLLTYPVPAELLRPRLPPGLELDLRDGHAFVSLVAFDFLDTRVRGIAWPGYRNFAELNLRYYVRRGDERGVVFIREIVPRHLITSIARGIYNEPYVTAPLASRTTEDANTVTAERRLIWCGTTHLISVTGRKPAFLPNETTDEHFFKEHHWGYGVSHRGRTTSYRVEHPAWEVYAVESYKLEFDWAAVYGPEWKFLEAQAPCSKVFAVGSPIAVYPKARV